MLRTFTAHPRSGGQLRLVSSGRRAAAPPADDGWHVTTTIDSGAELGRDWLEACEMRVRGRLETCRPLDSALPGVDDAPPSRGLLAQALDVLRDWHGRRLPTVQRTHLRVPDAANARRS